MQALVERLGVHSPSQRPPGMMESKQRGLAALSKNEVELQFWQSDVQISYNTLKD